MEIKSLQRRHHVAWRDAIDADADLSPFHGERGSKMAHGSFGGVVRSVLEGGVRSREG